METIIITTEADIEKIIERVIERKFTKPMYIFSIKFTDCLDFDLSVLIKTSIFINYQNIRYHE